MSLFVRGIIIYIARGKERDFFEAIRERVFFSGAKRRKGAVLIEEDRRDGVLCLYRGDLLGFF